MKPKLTYLVLVFCFQAKFRLISSLYNVESVLTSDDNDGVNNATGHQHSSNTGTFMVHNGEIPDDTEVPEHRSAIEIRNNVNTEINISPTEAPGISNGDLENQISTDQEDDYIRMYNAIVTMLDNDRTTNLRLHQIHMQVSGSSENHTHSMLRSSIMCLLCLCFPAAAMMIIFAKHMITNL